MALGLRAALVMLMASVAGATNLRSRAGMWGPADLQAVNKMLEGVLANPHMSQAQRQMVTKVAGEVRLDIDAVVKGGAGLSTESRKQKVQDAMKALAGLQGEMSKAMSTAPTDSQEQKLEGLQKELAAKQAELAKDEKQIKLAKLEKELAEKQLQLHGLEDHKTSDATDQKGQVDMVSKLSTVLGGSAKGSAVAAKLNDVVTNLQQRANNLTQAIEKIDAAEKSSGAELEATINKKVPTQAKDDPLTKGQAVLKMLKKKEHRRFEKSRALKKSELAEVNSAILSIKKGDMKGLQATIGKMNNELKSFDAKTGGFLH